MPKGRLAIGEVELPGPDEPVVETLGPDGVQPGYEGLAPQLERVRVVLAEVEPVDHLQAGAPGLGDERVGRGQHAARKHVLLDEVGATPIALEKRVVDHDRLHHTLTDQ